MYTDCVFRGEGFPEFWNSKRPTVDPRISIAGIWEHIVTGQSGAMREAVTAPTVWSPLTRPQHILASLALPGTGCIDGELILERSAPKGGSCRASAHCHPTCSCALSCVTLSFPSWGNGAGSARRCSGCWLCCRCRSRLRSASGVPSGTARLGAGDVGVKSSCWIAELRARSPWLVFAAR